MKKIFAVRDNPMDIDLILLLVRIVCGCAFIFHGTGKIQNPFGWMGREASIPGVFQALAAISEFGGGIALILGLVTRLGAFGIACTMIVAIYTHRFVLGDPFVNPTGGRSYELAAVYLVMALALIIIGPGRFSVDRRLFGVQPSAPSVDDTA